MSPRGLAGCQYRCGRESAAYRSRKRRIASPMQEGPARMRRQGDDKLSWASALAPRLPSKYSRISPMAVRAPLSATRPCGGGDCGLANRHNLCAMEILNFSPRGAYVTQHEEHGGLYDRCNRRHRWSGRGLLL